MLPKNLHLGQPCRQVDHRLSPPRAASCRPTDRQGSAAGRGRRCQAGQPRPGPPLGASRDHKHVCRSHLQGSFNYQTTTFFVPVCVFGKLQLCGAQLTMQLSPPHALQHEAWLARAASAPHVGDLSRRQLCAIVSAGAGAPRWWHDVVRRTPKPCLSPMEVAWFR